MANIKGVIVAAGYGSRFLPVTKTVPKEMLPLLDRPAIDFIAREFLESGIRDILIISSRRKKAMEDYFDRELELETVFPDGSQKREAIVPLKGHFHFVRQQQMKGTGHALLLAQSFTGSDPFIVAYPDDIVMASQPLSRQLIQAHEETGCSVLATQNLKGRDVSRYGVVDPQTSGNPCQVRSLVEKPTRGTEPSTLVSFGRYLFTPDLYRELHQGLANHGGGEYYHIGAINQLAAKGKVMALDFKGERLDTGEPLGYLEAICRYALTHPDFSKPARKLFAELSRSPEDSVR